MHNVKKRDVKELLWGWIRRERKHKENEAWSSCGLDVRGRKANLN